MSDLIQKQLAFTSALVTLSYWVIVLFIPFLASDQQVSSGVPLSFWVGACAAISYFSYTGLRAHRRGWKSRFVLRIVVPAALFFIGCIAIGFLSWLG